MLRTFFVPIFSLMLCVYSFSLGFWKIYPFEELKSLKDDIEIFFRLSEAQESEFTQDLKLEKIPKTFGNLLELNGAQFNESNILNNFTFNWTRLDDDRLKKIGSAELRGDKLWYINQDYNELIEQVSLTNKIAQNGGIKAMFSIGGINYAYVAYVDGMCASARIISLSSNNIVLQLPCLSKSDVDLNGVGGGWLKLSDNEILFSTGTPTSAHVENEINQLAQDDNSLWGKILKLTIENDNITAEIFTKGHRNPQGITNIEGDIIAVEHGPMGGDEINLIIKNNNYEWPLQSLGSEYDLNEINKSYSNSIDTNLPIFSFVPSIGISDANVCPKNYSEYYAPNKCVAISSMRGNSIYFVVYNKNKALFTEKIELGSRIRKLIVKGNQIIAVTDYEGIITGRLFKGWVNK